MYNNQVFFRKILITFISLKKVQKKRKKLLIIVILVAIINSQYVTNSHLIINQVVVVMNYETVELKSERLIIKKGEIKDFLKVYEYNFNKLKNIEGVCKLEKQEASKIEEWFGGNIKKYYTKIKKAHMFDWIIYLNNQAIGNILTEEENIEKRQIEVAYNLHPNYWGNGYMPEALTTVIEFLYTIGYDSVVCTYSDGNKKSKRVLDKLGFKPYKIIKDAWKSEYGNMIDDYKTIMTKEDWLSKTGRIKKTL